MPTITLSKSKKKLKVDHGANLMDTLIANNIPIASSCRGSGVCAKCKIIVINHPESLSAEDYIETFLREKNSIPTNERVSCQCLVLGDVEIDATYW